MTRLTKGEFCPRSRYTAEDFEVAQTFAMALAAVSAAASKVSSAKWEYRSVVYAHPAYIETLARSTPVSDHVTVDVALPGCPVDREELLEVLAALVQGRKPRLRQEPVCSDCRRAGQVCVLVAHGEPCLGPVTRGGCHALCPSVGRGCFGCFGPAEGADVASLGDRLVALTGSRAQVRRLFATVTAGAEPFRREAERQSVLAAAQEGS